MDLPGKVAVVTGAGSGIGRATAVELARRGCVVVVADVAADAGAETAALIGGDALAITADVSDPVSLVRLFDETERRFGAVQVVHNNAGLVNGDPQWPETPLDVIHRMVGVNVFGVMAGTRLAIAAMSGHGGGVVVNTASVAGLSPMPTDPVYSATKAAIINFTQSCGALHATHGVRVNAVLPGIVDTSMVAKTGDGTSPAAWLAPLLPLIGLLKPEEVAAGVVDLMCDETKFGQTVTVMNRGPEET